MECNKALFCGTCTLLSSFCFTPTSLHVFITLFTEFFRQETAVNRQRKGHGLKNITSLADVIRLFHQQMDREYWLSDNQKMLSSWSNNRPSWSFFQGRKKHQHLQLEVTRCKVDLKRRELIMTEFSFFSVTFPLTTYNFKVLFDGGLPPTPKSYFTTLSKLLLEHDFGVLFTTLVIRILRLVSKLMDVCMVVKWTFL